MDRLHPRRREFLKDGRVTNYSAREGVPAARVRGFAGVETEPCGRLSPAAWRGWKDSDGR